jgi:hypothetical protein
MPSPHRIGQAVQTQAATALLDRAWNTLDRPVNGEDDARSWPAGFTFRFRDAAGLL